CVSNMKVNSICGVSKSVRLKTPKRGYLKMDNHDAGPHGTKTEKLLGEWMPVVITNPYPADNAYRRMPLPVKLVDTLLQMRDAPGCIVQRPLHHTQNILVEVGVYDQGHRKIPAGHGLRRWYQRKHHRTGGKSGRAIHHLSRP